MFSWTLAKSLAVISLLVHELQPGARFSGWPARGPLLTGALRGCSPLAWDVKVHGLARVVDHLGKFLQTDRKRTAEERAGSERRGTPFTCGGTFHLRLDRPLHASEANRARLALLLCS